MTEQHIAVCEALDWRVHDDPEEDYVELEKYSPAGEDFIFQAQKDRHPSIHHTGSVRGMKKLGFWRKKDRCVRCGQYIYNLSMTIR